MRMTKFRPKHVAYSINKPCCPLTISWDWLWLHLFASQVYVFTSSYRLPCLIVFIDPHSSSLSEASLGLQMAEPVKRLRWAWLLSSQALRIRVIFCQIYFRIEYMSRSHWERKKKYAWAINILFYILDASGRLTVRVC